MTTFHERIRQRLTVAPDAQASEFHGAWTTWGELDRAVKGIEAALVLPV